MSGNYLGQSSSLSPTKRHERQVEESEDWRYVCETCDGAANTAGTVFERAKMVGMAKAHLRLNSGSAGPYDRACERVAILRWEDGDWHQKETITKDNL